VTAILLLLALQSAPLTERDVAAAMSAGEAKKHAPLISTCIATPGFSEGLFATGISPTGSHTVVVANARGLIAMRAFEGKRLYKPLTAGDVTDADRQPQLVVTVTADTPDNTGKAYRVPSPVQAVVLKLKNGTQAIQPVTFTTEPVEFKNLMGGVIASNSARATFGVAEFRAMPAGEIDVVVVTAAGERRCKIGRDDRAMLSR
jgi:hypothetical protein